MNHLRLEVTMTAETGCKEPGSTGEVNTLEGSKSVLALLQNFDQAEGFLTSQPFYFGDNLSTSETVPIPKVTASIPDTMVAYLKPQSQSTANTDMGSNTRVPADCTVHAELDFSKVSKHYELSGGNPATCFAFAASRMHLGPLCAGESFYKEDDTEILLEAQEDKAWVYKMNAANRPFRLTMNGSLWCKTDTSQDPQLAEIELVSIPVQQLMVSARSSSDPSRKSVMDTDKRRMQ